MHTQTDSDQRNLQRESGYLELIMSFILIFFHATTATTAAATSLVVLGNDWRANTLHFLLLFLDFFCVCLRVGIQPRLTILQGLHDLFLLIIVELLAETFVVTRSFSGGAHGVQVSIESVFGIHTLSD